MNTVHKNLLLTSLFTIASINTLEGMQRIVQLPHYLRATQRAQQLRCSHFPMITTPSRFIHPEDKPKKPTQKVHKGPVTECAENYFYYRLKTLIQEAKKADQVALSMPNQPDKQDEAHEKKRRVQEYEKMMHELGIRPH